MYLCRCLNMIPANVIERFSRVFSATELWNMQFMSMPSCTLAVTVGGCLYNMYVHSGNGIVMERSGYRSLLLQQCTDVATVYCPCSTRDRKEEEKRARKTASIIRLNLKLWEAFQSPTHWGDPVTRITRFLRRIVLRNRDTSQRQASQSLPSMTTSAMNVLFRGVINLSRLTWEMWMTNGRQNRMYIFNHYVK